MDICANDIESERGGAKMSEIKAGLSKISLKWKIFLVLVLVGVISFGWYSSTVRSEDRVTKAFSNMPIGAIRVINDLGEEDVLWVKIATTAEARRAGFSGVGENVVRETAILFIYPRNTTERHSVSGVRLPLEMGFFQEDGTLVSIARTTAGATTTYGAPARINYRYVLVVPQGYFARHGISVDGEAKLLPDSLLRAPTWR